MSKSVRMALLDPPLLSMRRGCVAAWHAGGLYGPALTSDGKLRDFIANTHHAAFVDSTNPLRLSPELNKWYVYFPGSSGNSATITLSNSTVYDYTVTYSDGTTATGTQTSTGAGLLTFGGTDVLFAGLKVRRIDVTADGGGATIADIDFSQRALWNAGRTSLTAVTGQTVTINRSTSGRKTSVVDRPLILFGTDDYLEVADHADLDFGAGAGMTVLMAYRTYNVAEQYVLVSKRNGLAGTATQIGYTMFSVAADAGGRFRTDDTSTTSLDTGPEVTAGVPTVAAGRRLATGGVESFVNGSGNGGLTGPAGTIANSLPLRIGATSAVTPAQFGNYEFFAAALFRRALSVAEIQDLNRELLGVPVQ